jgi:hypothetical protein
MKAACKRHNLRGLTSASECCYLRRVRLRASPAAANVGRRSGTIIIRRGTRRQGNRAYAEDMGTLGDDDMFAGGGSMFRRRH